MNWVFRWTNWPALPCRKVTGYRLPTRTYLSPFYENVTVTIKQLRKVLQAQPFCPFTVHMADGRSLYVPQEEFLSHSRNGRTVIVHDAGDGFSILDLLLINQLEVHGSGTAPPEDNGNA